MTGMVSVHWRRTMQKMLEKEPGAPWIHRIRIIEVFDTQANAEFQIFVGWKMVGQAVKRIYWEMNLLALYSRKNCSIGISGKNYLYGSIEDWAKSRWTVQYIYKPQGKDKSIGIFLARLMFQAKRHVKTKHGVFTQNICTTKKHMIYGIGQGSGVGSAMWIF